jgi:hypothetical protein
MKHGPARGRDAGTGLRTRGSRPLRAQALWHDARP